jgi:nitrite reductase/ring-hydroxylating ferredoxin subunit
MSPKQSEPMEVAVPAVKRADVPLWREEVSFRQAEERYVGRRQFGRFLVLTSAAMFAGNVWIWLRGRWKKLAEMAPRVIARRGEIPVGAVKPFDYPTANDPCLLIRRGPDEYVAFEQKCTHLSCAVVYSRERDRLECPCHQGYFSATSGAVLQGPPPRPLPRIRLLRQGDDLVAVGVETEQEL